MYDDIAHSTENPIPGKVFNQPDGKDVYHGCKASYTGKDVSAAKFLAVLTGDRKTAQGPVLRSSKRDNVFIYYADHGAPGLIAMPEDEEPVYAKDLNAALVEMKEKDMYNRLVFYLEACESGSMFKVRTRRGNEKRGRRDGVDAAASRAERYRDGVVPRRAS